MGVLLVVAGFYGSAGAAALFSDAPLALRRFLGCRDDPEPQNAGNAQECPGRRAVEMTPRS